MHSFVSCYHVNIKVTNACAHVKNLFFYPTQIAIGNILLAS